MPKQNADFKPVGARMGIQLGKVAVGLLAEGEATLRGLGDELG